MGNKMGRIALEDTGRKQDARFDGLVLFRLDKESATVL